MASKLPWASRPSPRRPTSTEPTTASNNRVTRGRMPQSRICSLLSCRAATSQRLLDAQEQAPEDHSKNTPTSAQPQNKWFTSYSLQPQNDEWNSGPRPASTTSKLLSRAALLSSCRPGRAASWSRRSARAAGMMSHHHCVSTTQRPQRRRQPPSSQEDRAQESYHDVAHVGDDVLLVNAPAQHQEGQDQQAHQLHGEAQQLRRAASSVISTPQVTVCGRTPAPAATRSSSRCCGAPTTPAPHTLTMSRPGRWMSHSLKKKAPMAAAV